MRDPVVEFMQSYQRIHQVIDHSEKFYRTFFDVLSSSDPHIHHVLHQQPSDRQIQIIRYSLSLAAEFSMTRQIPKKLESTREPHVGTDGLNLSTEHFDYWLSCLLTAVSQFDPQADEEVLLAWRMALTPVMVFMASRSSSDSWPSLADL